MNEYKALHSHPITEDTQTGQNSGKPQPAITKEMGKELILLPTDYQSVIQKNHFFNLVIERKSSRLYEDEPLSLQELSYLLWMTQGVKEIVGSAYPVTVRVVPSAGSRHALETYLFVNQIDGLESGCYHYLASQHALEHLRSDTAQIASLNAAFCGQSFFAKSAVAFVWTAIPERMAWRYADMAEKLILLDAGHVCQNLYLAGASIGCGVCATAAYEQKKADALLFLEKEDASEQEEFVIYAAAVGKK